VEQFVLVEAEGICRSRRISTLKWTSLQQPSGEPVVLDGSDG
jgi:hypothetical protein